jgi:hypothetical protein
MESKELAKLYYSLAATFKDKGDEMSALKYFEKEIELHGDNPVEVICNFLYFPLLTEIFNE